VYQSKEVEEGVDCIPGEAVEAIKQNAVGGKNVMVQRFGMDGTGFQLASLATGGAVYNEAFTVTHFLAVLGVMCTASIPRAIQCAVRRMATATVSPPKTVAPVATASTMVLGSGSVLEPAPSPGATEPGELLVNTPGVYEP
jgi:hypothetical protein